MLEELLEDNKNLEKINQKIKTVIKELGIEIKFNELASNLDIRLLKGSKKLILNIAEYISNGKIFKIKPINSGLKNKCIGYCLELRYGIIFSYVNIEAMNIISSDIEMNEFLANIPSNLFRRCLNN